MCGRWYLPIFLLRDGSLTPIRMVSVIDLARMQRETQKPIVNNEGSAKQLVNSYYYINVGASSY